MLYLKTKALLLMLPLFLLGTIIHAQETETNIRTERKMGLSLKAGGVIFGGINIDAFVSPDVNIGGTFFILPDYRSIGAGINYHPLGKDVSRRWSPYIGVEAGAIALDFSKVSISTSLYFPVGIHYIGKKGFNFSSDIGLYLFRKVLGSTSSIKGVFFGSIIVGYRFLNEKSK